jgi:hypothetical protein
VTAFVVVFVVVVIFAGIIATVYRLPPVSLLGNNAAARGGAAIHPDR